MPLVCDFEHLTSFVYTVNQTLVRFSYSNHVFTSTSEVSLNPAYKFMDRRGAIRFFDEDRYRLSKLLESHLRNLPRSKIYDEMHGNAFYFPVLDYRIVLSMERVKQEVRVRVETAFRAPPALNRHKMSFPVAVKRVLENKPLFPKKK